jgi:hypothetical protein
VLLTPLFRKRFFTGLTKVLQSAPGTCTDVAGNSANASLNHIDIDKTAPKVDLSYAAPAASGWYNHTSTVPAVVMVKAADLLSGVASISRNVNGIPTTLTGFVAGSTSTATFSVAAEGINSVSCTATDAVGNSGGPAVHATPPH